jgi:hypothetical protein
MKIKNFLKKIKEIISSFSQYNREEHNVFKAQMPAWYTYCQEALLMRILKLIMSFFIMLSYKETLQKKIKLIITYVFNRDFNFALLDNIYNIILFICISYFIFFTVLNFILGIIYYKKLIYNSPFNAQKCTMWGIRRICSLGFVAGMFGFGTSEIDHRLRRRGYVEIFDGYFQNATYKSFGRITNKMASENSKNLEVFDGTEFPGANIVREWGQNNTLKVQKEHHDIYQAQQQVAAIKNESKELIKNNQYKKD